MKLKTTIIKVNTKAIKGTGRVSDIVCNISSIPRPYVSKVVSRIPDSPSEFRLVPITPVEMYNTIKNRYNIKKRQKKDVTIVYDSDDKMANIKMKNLSYINNWKIISKVEIEKEKTTRTTKGGTGMREVRIMNHHHTEEMKQVLYAKPINKDSMQVTLDIVIVKTKDKLCGSIAGLTHICALYDIPYKKEEVIITDQLTWLLMVKSVKKYKIDLIEEAKFDKQGKSVSWVYQSGYTNNITTQDKIMNVNILEIQKTDNKDTEKIRNIIQQIKDIIRTTLTVIGNAIKRVLIKIGLVNDQNNIKQKDDS
jgi:hypothetical protein